MANRNSEELEEALRHLASGETEFAADLENSIKEAVDRASGKVKAQVTSAVDLNTREKEQMKKALEGLLKRQIGVIYQVEPIVLGGFKVRVGDWKLDGTLATKIEKLTKLLTMGTYG